MNWMTAGADLGQMLTGVAAVGAFGLWLWKQAGDWCEQRNAKKLRDWHGYIETTGINSWHVRLAEDPESPTSRVVLDVVKDNGEPDGNWAQNLRQRIQGDGMLARVPTEEEYDFLKALHKDRGYGKGFVVR